MLEISVSDLDKDGFLLNTPDGTYYLPEGLEGKRDHSPEDYITKITAAAPGDKGEKPLIYFMGISAVGIYAVEVSADPEGRSESLQHIFCGTGVGCHA